MKRCLNIGYLQIAPPKNGLTVSAVRRRKSIRSGAKIRWSRAKTLGSKVSQEKLSSAARLFLTPLR